MKKFLISLLKDKQRRELFFSQPDTADFEIFNAINTMDKSEESLAEIFDKDQFQQHYGRKVTGGEIGCTLSHLRVYEKIVDNQIIAENEYVLVCEDDALFAENFQTSLNQMIKQEISSDIILIGQSKILDFNDKELLINYPTTFPFLRHNIKNTRYQYAYPYKNYFAGTVAYLIRKSAARIFLRQIEHYGKPFWLADDYILFENRFKIDTLVIRPLMAIENPALISNLEEVRGSVSNNMVKKLLKYPLKQFMALIRNF